jgi:hypothetical protein
LTTWVVPASNAAVPADDVELLVLLAPPLLQAVITSAAIAPTAVAAKVLRLFMR